MTVFDSKIHLAYQPPTGHFTMMDLGYPGVGIADVGLTEPFPLLSPEGVRALRGEIFTKPVLDSYSGL